MRLDLILIGFGNVARRFVRLIDERADRLRSDHDLECRTIGIATRRHGAVIDLDGLDACRAAAIVEARGQLDAMASGTVAQTHGMPDGSARRFISDVVAQAIARDPSARVVMVESTVLDVRTGQPAIDHVQAALECGAHVISVNKGPVACAARDLGELARRCGRCFFFEGAVMDGIPVFNLVRETLPALSVIGFRGIVNSTTNHILTAMEAGREFAGALAEMQAAGIAEADASLDIDGWDSAAKTAALINVLMGGDTTPAAIDRAGIGHLTGEAVREALRRGTPIRLVASASRTAEGRIAGRVAPECLDRSDLLATVTGMQNALTIRTDLVGEISIVQRDSGLTQTAYALLSDLVAVRRRIT